MKIVAEESRPGRIWALHVYTRLSRRLFARFIAKMVGVEVVRKPKLLSFLREEEFMEFRFRGQLFCVEVEPVSHACFEIHPKPGGCKPETDALLKQMAAMI